MSTNYEQAYAAIKASVMALHKKLGPQYQTCYLYGSLAQGLYQPQQSDINLLAVVDDATDIHAVHEALHPVWARHGQVMRRTPGVATESAFKRHMLLNPILARHIAKYGKQVKGDRPLLPQTSPLDKTRYVAHVAAQLISASRALWPDLLATAQERESALLMLRRLARQFRKGDVDADERALDLFVELQTDLSQRMALLNLVLPLATGLGEPLYPIPTLQAVYERGDQLVLVIADPRQLGRINQAALHKLMEGRYRGLQWATPAQLQLAVEYEFPLEYTLRSFRHVWGEKIIEQLHPPTWRILRDAARSAADIQVFDLPHAYISSAAGEEQMRKLIHDFQNKLLNTRLQTELLGRVKLIQPVEPAVVLPDRSASTAEQVGGIFALFDWWSEFYKEGMLNAV